MNVSKLIYKNLLQHEVKDVFMYSGGAIMPLIDQFYNGEINYYINSHEQNCGHAATGYAKTSGKTGISIVTSGPGVTNSITPLLDATNDSTPFILLSGNVALKNMGTNAFQEAPSVEITKPVTKWSHCVETPDEVNDVMYEAFKVANTGKKGSVHIDFPKCILTSETNNVKESIVDLDKFNNKIECSIPMEEIANIILNSERPILYVGQGAINASDYIRELAIQYQIPVTTTLHGMGIFDENDDISLKMCGMHGHAAANYALQEADCIIAVGSRFDDRTTGNVDKYAPKCKNFIHLNIDKSEINKVVQSHYIIGKCEKTVQLLLDELRFNRGNHHSYNINWCNKVIKWKKKYGYKYKECSDNKIKTQDVLKELNKHVQLNDDKFIFTSGVGNHQMMSTQYINWKYPNRFISSGSLGVMGAGLPYAIGAQIANSDKTVIDIDGDSSFNMTSSDMKTIVENNLPIKILILNNETQDMVRIWEKIFFEGRITATSNTRNPDFKKLANAYGIYGLTCNNGKDLEDRMNDFIQYNNGPILLECKVEPDICLPLVAPNAGLDEMILFDEEYKILKGECPN
jgi:acetolactate synthase I/II/III large subunit